MSDDDLHFIQDGHKLALWWNKDEVAINNVICPNEGKSGFCNRGRDYCVVERFVWTYGLDVNIGSAEIQSPVEVAWVPRSGGSDLDPEFAEVYVVPIADREYLLAKSRSAES